MRQPIRPTLPTVSTVLHLCQPVARAVTSTVLTVAGFAMLAAPSLLTGPM
ncbi:hypothetical protein NNL26_03260 [Micrococcus luteus]|nr:hypothetical protein [Micrococcus luteus]UTX35275.1 hypothetical protein NNL26_03260 [Micrococcus luteus]